ncbi:MAG TPA: AI-2E family transporter [Terriglobales bacterium]|nr:AI-2E family transporter [Terriglobales bacterium]
MADSIQMQSQSEADPIPPGEGSMHQPATPPSSPPSENLLRIQAAAETVIATAVVLAGMYYAQLPLIVLLVSILLAFVLAPVMEAIVRLRAPRPLAAALATVLLVGAFYGGFHVSYNRAQAFLDEFPRYSGEIRKMMTSVRQRAEKIQKTTEGALGAESQKNPTPPASQPNWSQLITSHFGPITEIIFIVSFIPFLVYFMLTWQDHVRTQSVMLFRVENRSTAYVTLGLISSMIRSFIVGNVLVGLFMSAISIVVFGLIGLPYFYFLGFISGFLSLVPYLGVVLAIVPPVAAGLGRVHSTEIVITIVSVFLLHLFALNVLYPKFLGSRLKLNPLTVTLALMFWGWLWGGMGLILAIPITGALKIIFDHVDSLRGYGAWLGE